MSKDNMNNGEAFQEIPRISLQKQIVEQIEHLIEDGKLKNGERLPSERKLSEIFKVSRHSVREAIRTLEEKHVLKSKPGSGTYVAIEDKSSAIEYLASVIDVEIKEQSEIFQFRKMIEPQIAGLAATNATKENISELINIYNCQKEPNKNFEHYKKHDEAFHLLLAKSTGNSILVKIMELLTEILAKSRVDFLNNTNRNKQSLSGHKQILDAIKKKDQIQAEKAMLKHISIIERQLTNKIENSKV